MKKITPLLSSVIVSIAMLGGGSGCEDKAAADALRQIEGLKQKQKNTEEELARKRQELEEERNKQEEARRKQEDEDRKQQDARLKLEDDRRTLGEERRKLEEESKKLQYLRQTAAPNVEKAPLPEKKADQGVSNLKQRFKLISQARYNVDLRQLTQFKAMVDSSPDLPEALRTAASELYKIGLAIRSGTRTQERSGLPADCFRNTVCPECRSGKKGGFGQETTVCGKCEGTGYLKDSYEFNPAAAREAYRLRLETIDAYFSLL